MEYAVEKLFSPVVMQQAAFFFGLDPDPMQLLGDFENYVYAAKKDGQPVIARFTHSSHRSIEQIQAEMDWMNELVRHGVSVPACFTSVNGRLTERIAAEDSYFSVIVMEKAKGHSPDYKNKAEWNVSLFHEWGRVTGHMHRITRQYAAVPGRIRRPEWHVDELLVHSGVYGSRGNPLVLQRLEEIRRQLAQLSTKEDGYGLIHSDIHPRNFFIDGEKVTVFDFDDCAYHWFVQDIAIPVYYAVSWSVPVSQNRDEFGNAFLQAFWHGYKKEYALDAAWLRHLPLFLKLRDVVLYLVLIKKMEPEQRSERIVKWLAEIEDRIIQGIPIVQIETQAL